MPEYSEVSDSGVLLPSSTAEDVRQERLDELRERTDDLIGNKLKGGRGNVDRDPLAAQDFAKLKVNDISEKQINALMDTSWIAEIIVDQFSEFATRSGATVEVEETKRVGADLAEELEESIERWLNEQGVYAVLQRQVEKERESGEGYILPVTRELEDRGWDEPIPRRPEDVEAFNVFGKHKISNRKINEDVLSADFNDLEWIKVDTTVDGARQRETIHPSRFTALISRRIRSEDEELGLSVFRRMINVLRSIINAEWSVGQIVFSMVFKVLKTNISDMDDQRQLEAANRMLEDHYNALSLAMIGQDDELQVKGLGQGLGGAGAVFDFLKDLISAATRVPKTILFGNNSGTIAGSEQDEINYFSRIANFQGTYLTPQLRWIIDLGLKARQAIEIPMRRNGRPVVSPDDVRYTVNWSKIFDLTEKEQAELEKTRAETEFTKSNTGLNLVNVGGITPAELPDFVDLEGVEDSAAIRAARQVEEEFEDRIQEEIRAARNGGR